MAKQPDPIEITEAWHTFKATGDLSARARLIMHYQPLVTSVAKRLGGTLPQHIDDEDLMSYGLFGLMDAMEKFDLEKGVKFETYASMRIKGSIIDELRTIDWIPRSVRAQVRDITQAVHGLEVQLQRAPTDTEVAEYLDMTVAELAHARSQQNFIHVGALDAMVDPEGESEYSLMHQLEDMRSQSPTGAYETEEIKKSLANAVSNLPEREAIVLCLYYYEGLTLAEIGQALNVTESRVCQMHTRAMGSVRGRLAVV